MLQSSAGHDHGTRRRHLCWSGGERASKNRLNSTRRLVRSILVRRLTKNWTSAIFFLIFMNIIIIIIII